MSALVGLQILYPTRADTWVCPYRTFSTQNLHTYRDLGLAGQGSEPGDLGECKVNVYSAALTLSFFDSLRMTERSWVALPGHFLDLASVLDQGSVARGQA